ncbi:MAG TPA: protein kinase [Gaiellaceae bacterium]|nr:protein kinase [Gaiellaceae bacterium]
MPGSRSTTHAASRAPRAGDQIADRYDLEELYGSGGMSSVFRAHDVQLDRRVAVKILHQRYAGEDEYVERFRREARAVAQLSHPNIVTVIDRGEDGGRQYIVFEFVEGENLKDLILRSGPLPLRRAIELTVAVADGLAFAHKRGLVHRDVKPQNVLLSSAGEVKVTDFGIARSLEVDHGVTQTGTVLGTGEYLAPEQASGEPVSPATDVYSLGVVLWELLAGEVPFGGESFVAIAMRHVNEPPPDVREVRPDVPPRLAAAVERALRKDPAQRFPTMEAFADELRSCLAALDADTGPDIGATAVIPAQRPPSDNLLLSRKPRTRRSFRPLGYAILALAFAVAGLVAALVFGGAGQHGAKGRGGGGAGGGSGAAVHLSAVGDYDPQGDGGELSYTAHFATDGSLATDWQTERYNTPEFGGLKSGLGLVVSTGRAVTLRRLTVHTPTPGFLARIEVGNSEQGPFAVDSGTETVANGTTFSLDGKSGSYYVVWLTRLPAGGTAEISELSASR